MRAPLLALLALLFGLEACSSVSETAGRINPFDGGDEDDDADAPDRERRVSFLTFDETLQVDETRAAIGVTLPAAYVNASWPQEGGFASHAVEHPAANADLSRAWRRNV